MKIVKFSFFISIFVFACIGILFTSVFIAMQFGWLNVRGSIESRNDSIELIKHALVDAVDTDTEDTLALIPNVLAATIPPTNYSCTTKHSTCHWSSTSEWSVVAGGLTKDTDLIQRVSNETGVSARLIAAVVVPEQIRFFTSNREVFKRYFEPLKILGSLSKFSLGVSGIKQETAEGIERNALNPNSVFYPGENYAILIAYNNEPNHKQTLYNRLTNEKDHYYSYLYTAIFIKEILAQWERAGHDISNQPEIVATIFNLGFIHSIPKTNPEMGGTTVSVGGIDYKFGELAGLFYHSDQLPILQ